MRTRRLDVRVLGALEVREPERSLPLGGGKQKTLLALLVIHRNEAISTDRIVDALWAGSSPPSAENSVHVYVSNLRKALGSDRIETQDRGYRLRLEPEELDVDRFERRVAEGRAELAAGRAARAAESFRAGLGLWRGDALGEFTHDDFAQPEIRRLNELRLSATEEQLDAELDLGRASALVPELESLVHEHPLRERLRRQLMLALYRSGRQAEALERYREGRRLLVQELGIEPGRELQELERAILTHDQELDRPTRKQRVAVRRTRGRLVALAVGAALLLVAAGGFAYAETRGSGRHVTIAGNAVAVIDPNSNRVVDGIPVGARPDAIASGSGSVWVGNLDDETVSRIDPRSDRQVRAISVGFVPSSLAAGSGSVWVAGSNARAPVLLVARLDPQFDVVSRLTRLQNAAADGSGLVAVDSTAVWAAPSYGLLTRLDPGSGQPQRRIDPSTSPTGMALGEGAVWLTESDGDILTRVDRTGLVTTTAVGHGPSGVAVGAGAVWVTDTLDDTLLQIDPSTRVVTRLIRVGKGPLGVAVGAGAVWVANSRDGTVSRVDPETGRVQRIAVGGSPRQLVVADGKVWVTVQAQTIVPEIASGGTVRLTSQQDVDSTDPALAFTPLAWQLLYATCAKLVNYPDETAPRGSQLVPEVASSLPKRSSDGKTYVFTIRPGFRFSPPSNQPVTAQTFRYTIERSLSPTLNGQAQGFLQDVVGAADYMAGRATHVSGIIVRGDTLTIHLRAPAADLPARLALPFFCAVPLGTPADPRGLRAIPSAGPYFVASYTPGEGAVLDRNPNYHGNRPHRLRQITLTVGTSLSQGTREVEAGTADYEAGGVPPSDDQRLLRRYGPSSPAALAAHQQLFVNPQLELDYLALNVARPLFAGTALRRAVNYTVDRQALAEVGSFSSGLPARPTSQYLPPGLPGFRESQPYPLRPNLARARSLASDRHRRAVMYTCDTSPCPELAALLRTELQAIGIDVEVKTMTVSELFARISKKGEPFDIALVAYKADYADPSDFLNLLLDGRKIGTPNNLDFAYFADPGWIRKLHAAAQLSGPARYLTYSRLANKIARDAAPWVPIDNSTVHDFFSRRIGCQVYQPLYGMDIAALCIKSRK